MSWSDYMKKEGWKEYPCLEHGVPYCPICVPKLEAEAKAGETVCVHMNQPFECPICREKRDEP